MRVDADQFGVEIRVLSDQDIWIPTHGNKDSVNTTADRCQENLADLQANQECKCHNHRGECSATVVGGIGELQVQVREQCTEVCHEKTAHGQDRPGKTIVD